MGPKKVPEKKKPSKGDPAAGGELDPDTKIRMLLHQVASLQVQLSERSEETSMAVAAKREHQTRIDEIAEENEQLKRRTADIKQDMTRQYTSMQESLLNHINQLEKANGDLRDLFAEADIKKEAIVKQKDAIIQIKDEEIGNLKQKIDTMSDEFGEMLRETLDKMKERIEISGGNFDTPELQIQQKIEELKIE